MTYLKGVVLALLLANIGYYLWAVKEPRQTIPAATAGSAPGIKLASEVRAAGAATSVTPAEPVAAAAPVEAPVLLTNVQRCVSVGPFRDVAEATRASTSLRTRGYGPRQRVAEGEVWAGVWVYLPRPQDAVATNQLLARLKNAGVDDALEMPGPGEAPVISLGLFNEPRRAQVRVEQLQSLDLKPVVADRKRNANVFWVDVDLRSTDNLLNVADLQGDAGRDAGNRIVRMELKGCPG